jgi:hypothetical protein
LSSLDLNGTIPYAPGMDLKRVTTQFEIGAYRSAVPHGTGHINDTYLVESVVGKTPCRTILQRINRRVFPNPPGIMENIRRVLEHAHKKLAGMGPEERSRRLLELVPARDGGCYWLDETGEFWRAYRFIEGARGFDVAQSPAQGFEAARAFGAFQRMIRDLPSPPLVETIPRFHDTPERLRRLEAAVEADSRNRAAGAKREIEFCLARRGLAGSLLGLKEEGILAESPVHNDTKLNNVLLDENSGEGLCVIDLDTVMPGLTVWDFGDLVRSASNRAAEDERNTERVEVDRELFKAIAEGWLQALSSAISPRERDALVTGAKVITLECGARFLTDYLEGDHYFKTSRPDQNLDRCRVQFALLRSLESREEELEQVIRRSELGA